MTTTLGEKVSIFDGKNVALHDTWPYLATGAPVAVGAELELLILVVDTTVLLLFTVLEGVEDATVEDGAGAEPESGG